MEQTEFLRPGAVEYKRQCLLHQLRLRSSPWSSQKTNKLTYFSSPNFNLPSPQPLALRRGRVDRAEQVRLDRVCLGWLAHAARFHSSESSVKEGEEEEGKKKIGEKLENSNCNWRVWRSYEDGRRRRRFVKMLSVEKKFLGKVAK